MSKKWKMIWTTSGVIGYIRYISIFDIVEKQNVEPIEFIMIIFLMALMYCVPIYAITSIFEYIVETIRGEKR